MGCTRPRIVIADDHRLLAELCKSLLEPEFSVVAIAGDGAALVSAVAELRPDLIVVDIGMPVLNGFEAAEQVHQSWPEVKIVFLTMENHPELAAEAYRRGASGFLHKTCASEELVLAVRAVLAGLTYP
jgi:DNA-binding NarL/FixJ family response regulator